MGRRFLIAHLRKHDVPCRTGGDEFMVLLPDLTAADCVPVIARLREELTQANLGRPIQSALAIGSASWPEVSASCEKYPGNSRREDVTDKRAQKAAAGGVPRHAPPVAPAAAGWQPRARPSSGPPPGERLDFEEMRSGSRRSPLRAP